ALIRPPQRAARREATARILKGVSAWMPKLTLKEDGTGKLLNPESKEEDITWEIGDIGAKVTFSKGSFTLLNDGDYLIADMAELAGERLYYVLVRA
ncbi:MAG: hypothetical protein Q4B54_14525, partial [Coriobacteriales bacterium]|nr:hypothetical protein [Coriobacteriales bacterium]